MRAVIRSCRLPEKKTYLAEQVDVGVRIAPAPKQSTEYATCQQIANESYRSG